MKRQKRRRKLAAVPTDVAPTASFVAVDRIVRLAEESGWPRKEAFHVAMLLTAHGTTVSEARQLLADAGRRVQ